MKAEHAHRPGSTQNQRNPVECAVCIPDEQGFKVSKGLFETGKRKERWKRELEMSFETQKRKERRKREQEVCLRQGEEKIETEERRGSG